MIMAGSRGGAGALVVEGEAVALDRLLDAVLWELGHSALLI